MLDRLASWLRSAEGPERDDDRPEDPLAVAAAALMIEASRLDDGIDEDERSRINELLQWRFKLDQAATAAVVREAERQAQDATQLFGFTTTIRDNTAVEERVKIVEMLWDVAYADGHLHELEASLLRRIAGLLYVSDKESGAARRRVMTRYGIAETPSSL